MLFLTRHNKSESFETDKISFGPCRKESKVVLLRNVTPLPVAWRVTSLEHLGDDFTVSTMQGTIPPKAEYSLQVHFLPSKPVNIKRVIRLEVRLHISSDLVIKCVHIGFPDRHTYTYPHTTTARFPSYVLPTDPHLTTINPRCLILHTVVSSIKAVSLVADFLVPGTEHSFNAE